MDDENAPPDVALPIEGWEVSRERKHLPQELQRLLQAETTILRVDRVIDEKIRTKHVLDYVYYEQFDLTIASWQVVCTSSLDSQDIPIHLASKWEISCNVEGKWVLVVIGRHQDTRSFNLVSLYRVRPRAIVQRREEGRIRWERKE